MNNPLKKVVDGNYCIGCGNCAYIGNTEMKINKYGEYIPELGKTENESEEKKLELVCPQLKPELDETELSKKFLKTSYRSDIIGGYNNIYAGHVIDPRVRRKSTSGGFGTWIASQLIENKLVDGIIHVNESDSPSKFFEYSISFSLNDVKSKSKTKYHVLNYNDILKEIKNDGKTYAFFGTPCFVKGIRRLQLVEPSNIKFTVSVVCGHQKSINWTKLFLWNKQLFKSQIQNYSYRKKSKNIPVNKYYTQIIDKSKNEHVIKNSEIVGGLFNQGALMLPACEFCDDIFGETADITIGDAWLPEYMNDNYGTNLIVTRNEVFDDLIYNGIHEKSIKIEKTSLKDAIKSQSGGVRQRREGLSYRLFLKKKNNEWHPKKRVISTSLKLKPLRRIIYRLRSKIVFKSRELFVEAKTQNDLNIFNQLDSLLKLTRYVEIFSRIFPLLKRKIQLWIKRK